MFLHAMVIKMHLWCLQHNIQACLRGNSHAQFDLISNIVDLCQTHSGIKIDVGNVVRDPSQT